MALDIDDLRQLNQKSIDTLNARADMLRDLKDGLPLDERASVLATISDLDTRVRTLEFTQEHLAAASIVVEFTPADEAALSQLGNQLDAFIAQDAQLNAVLTSLPAVMNAAVRIDALISGHTAQA